MSTQPSEPPCTKPPEESRPGCECQPPFVIIGGISHMRAGLRVGSESVGAGPQRLISDNVEEDKRCRSRRDVLSKPGRRLLACQRGLRGAAPHSSVDYAPPHYNLSGFMMSVMPGVHLFNLLCCRSLCDATISNVPICHVVRCGFAQTNTHRVTDAPAELINMVLSL